MKRRLHPLIVGAILLITPLHAQVTFDVGSSSWGAGGTFGGTATNGQTAVGSYQAYYGATTTGSLYTLGFVNTSTPPFGPGDFNLSSTVLDAGIQLTLVFTGFTAVPRYIAYTGGALTGYTFNSGTGTLTLTTSTVDPAASASDPTGATLASAFGLIIETGGPLDFHGTVFRTNGFWNDIAAMADGYVGDMPLAGVNFAGVNGQSVSFDAYLSLAFLQSIGITSPAECAAYLQKAGVSNYLAITRQLFGNGGVDPGLAGDYTFGGDSTFDFNGAAGVDDYLIASYANASWSEGNIGVAAIPEPGASSALLALGALGLVLLRRRPMR